MKGAQKKTWPDGSVMRYFAPRESTTCIAHLFALPLPMPIVVFFKPPTAQ